MSFAMRPLSGVAGLFQRCSLVGLILLAFAAPRFVADAAAADVFTVSGVAVDETADTASAARAAAFRRGQRAALDTLLRRLTRRSDHSRLPAVELDRLDFMVQAFEVANERTSNVRYLATMTVTFKPAEIRRLLRDAGLPFAETQSKPVLVLPVVRRDGAVALWDDPNIWRDAWAQLPPGNDLVPLIVPVGDLSDIADVDADQAMERDPLRLSAIASRYGAGDVLVAVATFSGTPQAQRIEIDARRVAASGQGPIRRTLQSNDPAAVPGLLVEAVASISAALEDAWKARNIIEFDRQGRMLLAVPLTSLEQWISVERRLNNVPSISSVSLLSLTRDSAAIEIVHFGDEAQLASSLAQQDLALDPSSPISVAADPLQPNQTTGAARIRVLRPLTP